MTAMGFVLGTIPFSLVLLIGTIATELSNEFSPRIDRIVNGPTLREAMNEYYYGHETPPKWEVDAWHIYKADYPAKARQYIRSISRSEDNND
jgi:hypothetical protein